jgi:hypothetical protein
MVLNQRGCSVDRMDYLQDIWANSHRFRYVWVLFNGKLKVLSIRLIHQPNTYHYASSYVETPFAASIYPLEMHLRNHDSR